MGSKKSDKKRADLSLLKSRLLLATVDFIDYDPDEEAEYNMKAVLKSYSYAREEVKEAFKFIFNYLKNDRTINKKPTRADITEVKKKINEIAKLVWKSKKR